MRAGPSSLRLGGQRRSGAFCRTDQCGTATRRRSGAPPRRWAAQRQCLGSALARLEAQVALPMLVRRFPRAGALRRWPDLGGPDNVRWGRLAGGAPRRLKLCTASGRRQPAAPSASRSSTSFIARPGSGDRGCSIAPSGVRKTKVTLVTGSPVAAPTTTKAYEAPSAGDSPRPGRARLFGSGVR